MAISTDEELMLQVKDGDRAAFNSLMDRYEKPVMNMIYRYLQDYDIAQDLMQETFLRVYRARQRYEVRSKFSTWLFQVAVNLCLNERRARSYRNHDSIEAMAGSEIPCELEGSSSFHPDEQIRKKELAECVRQAIRSLPKDERAMVILSKWEDKSYEEIAAIMGTSVDAVKSRLYRAKKMLRKDLDEFMEEHEKITG